MIARRGSGLVRSRRRGTRGRPILIATLALTLGVVGLQLPAVAAGDVAVATARTENQKLVAPTRQDGAAFGGAVTTDGDRIVVGSPYFNGAHNDAGVVHAFDRTTSNWQFEPPAILSDDPQANGRFGYSAAVDGETLVVGAPGENGLDGAAYTYERHGTEWVFQQELMAPDPAATDAWFGTSVDIQGDRLVVGAHGHSSFKGVVYVFAEDDSAWVFEQALTGSGTGTGDEFGGAVALDGDRVLVGARGVNALEGAAFVFSRDGSDWVEEERINPGAGFGGRFGDDVDLSGRTALVGAPTNDSSRGAAYAYVLAADDWELQQKILASDGASDDLFGGAVAIAADGAVIGAAEDDGSGSAYVFDRSGSTWRQRDKLLAADGEAGDYFGSTVTMRGDTAIVGALGEGNGKGAAYVFDGILGPYDPVELEGATRYETAIAASQEAFPDGADTVVMATGENWPDALGGAALAGARDAPILLTLGAGVPASVMNEIERLGATDAIILGGPGAVAPAVETALATKLGATNVRRIGGATRYETAELIARAVETKVGANYDGTAFVATGLNSPDALAGSPLSAAGPWPIFLAPATGMTPSTLATMNDIGVTDVLILGGTGAVSQAIEDGLAAGASGDVTRLAGPTRYETAVEVAGYGVDEARLRWNGVALATGENFPDALAGGPLQGRKGSVMLLTHTAFLTASTDTALQDEAKDIATVRFLGGPGALSQTVRDDVKAILE